jgi:hypothetical protein
MMSAKKEFKNGNEVITVEIQESYIVVGHRERFESREHEAWVENETFSEIVAWVNAQRAGTKA